MILYCFSLNVRSKDDSTVLAIASLAFGSSDNLCPITFLFVEFLMLLQDR